MKYLIRLIALSLTLLATQLSFASIKILGGEIQYSYIDSNQYILEVVVYKDCNSDAFGPSKLYGISGTDTLSWNLTTPDSGQDLTSLGTGCGIKSACQGGFPYGIMEFRYTLSVDLSGKGNCSWLFLWQYGERSAYLNSGMSNEGFTIQAELNSCLPGNSLQFKNQPQFFYCQGEYEFTDFSLNPTEGIDSVAYDLVPAWKGLNTSVTYNSNVNFNFPINLMYRNWYGNGVLRFRGTRVNDAAPMKVRARAWVRGGHGNMVFIGAIFRDVEYRVTACGGNNQPGIQRVQAGNGFIQVCPGDTLELEVESFDADILDSTFLSFSAPREDIGFTTTNGQDLKARGTIHWIVPNEADMFQGQAQRVYEVIVFVRDNGCDLQRSNAQQFHIAVGLAGEPPVYLAGPDIQVIGSSSPIIPQGFDSVSSPGVRAYWSAVEAGLGSFNDPYATQPRFTLTNSGQRHCEYQLVRSTFINNHCQVYQFSDTMLVTRQLDSFDAGPMGVYQYTGNDQIELNPPLGSYVHSYQWITNGNGSFENRFFPITKYYVDQQDMENCEIWFWLKRDIEPGCGQELDSMKYTILQLPPSVYFRTIDWNNGKAKAVNFIAEHPLLGSGTEVRVVFNDSLNGPEKFVPLNTLFNYELTAQDAQRGYLRVYAQVDKPCKSSLDFQLEIRLDTVNITSLASNIEKDFKVYPNPAKESLTVETHESLVKLEVMDLQGRVLMESKRKQLDVTPLAPGMYLLHIEFEDGTTANIRWQKQ